MLPIVTVPKPLGGGTQLPQGACLFKIAPIELQALPQVMPVRLLPCREVTSFEFTQ